MDITQATISINRLLSVLNNVAAKVEDNTNMRPPLLRLPPLLQQQRRQQQQRLQPLLCKNNKFSNTIITSLRQLLRLHWLFRLLLPLHMRPLLHPMLTR